MASIPMVQLLSIDKANDVKLIEDGFMSLSNMFDIISKNRGIKNIETPPWVLMAIAIVWIPIFFIFAALSQKTAHLDLSIMRAEANLV